MSLYSPGIVYYDVVPPLAIDCLLPPVRRQVADYARTHLNARHLACNHIPYASKHMPNVRGAENMRVLTAADGNPAPYYRVSQLSYDTAEDLRAGIATDEGRSVIAHLANFATGGATLLIAEEDD